MSAPVKNTCPDIDKCIKWIKSAIRTAEYGMKNCEKSSDEYDNYRSIISDIEDCEGIMEDLRNSNDELRQWGKQMEEEAESLQVYIDELELKKETI